MAHTKHQAVRTLYDACCGHCGVSETDMGGALTVDHFDPVSAGGDDSDDNLVYACFRCNLYKGFLLPGSIHRQQEHRLLRHLRDNIAEHIREDEVTGRLEGRTATGTFHINSLRLNRVELVAHRLRLRVNQLQEAHYAQVLMENKRLRERLKRRETLRQFPTRRRRGKPPPDL